MPEAPILITGKTLEELRDQLQLIVDDLYQERVAGAEIGDVLTVEDNNILTVNVATSGGIYKVNNELAVETDVTDALYYLKTIFISSSAGAADAGKPIVLDADGNIDASMINDADIDHGSIGGLSDDDHTQYHNDTRGDARYAKKGVNADITSMTGLDNDGIPLAKVANAASDGANADITSMTGLDNDGIPAAKIDGDTEKAVVGAAKTYLRTIQVAINDGTDAGTIMCFVGNRYNGDDIASTDNIAKGGTTGNFSLNAGGDTLTIEASGLTGNCVGVVSCWVELQQAINYVLYVEAKMVSNDIVLIFRSASGIQDLTSIIDTGAIYLAITYFTDA